VDDGRATLEGRWLSARGRKLVRWTRRHRRHLLGQIALVGAADARRGRRLRPAQGGSAVLVLLALALVFLRLRPRWPWFDWWSPWLCAPDSAQAQSLREQGAHGIPTHAAPWCGAGDVSQRTQRSPRACSKSSSTIFATRPQPLFALLTDLAMPMSSICLATSPVEQARAGIGVLNARYESKPGAQGGPFCMFHRERRWNEQEGRWIGWERKRGPTPRAEPLLRGVTDTSITSSIGRAEQLRLVKYVITLDADTILGQDGARRLVATLAHPLNHARPIH